MRKKFPRIGILALLLIAIFVALLILPIRSEGNSPDQEKVIDLMGYPNQFVISYIESGNEDTPQLVRDEIWFYPESGMKVTFLAGQLVYSEEYSSVSDVEPTKYKPEDFEFYQTSRDISNLIGKENLVEADGLPGITDESDVKIYTDGDVMVLMENGYVTYVQTFLYTEEATE